MNHRQALWGLHISAVAFGLTGVFGKLALASAAVVVFGRACFAVLSLLVVAGRASDRRLPSPRQLAWLGLAGLALGGHWLTFFHAVKLAGVAIGTLGFASFPAFTVLLEAVVFRERIRATEWALVALVTGGLLLVTPPAQAGSTLGTGLAWAVFSGFLFSVYSLMSRVSAGKLNPAQTAMWQNMAIALVLLPVVWTQLPQVRAMDWFWMAMLGVFCTGVAHSIFVASLSVLKARTASMFFALEPVYGIAIAWVLFHERPTPLMLVGGLLIIAAIALTSLRKAPEPAAAV